MLIPIRPADGAMPAVWAMIELQGEIHRNDDDGTSRGFDVGTLTTSPTGSIHLTIGYHQLEGSVQKLKKPLAVLTKLAPAESRMEGKNDLEYKVIGVVREKYIFKARPKALISKPPSKD